MKKLALVVALALVLLPLAVPASAAEIAKTAPAATTVEQQTQAPLPWLEVIIKPIPRCSAAQGTACSPVGSTMACTDACHNQLSCTCVFFNNQRFWNCSIEC
jgi:hypothetical protein